MKKKNPEESDFGSTTMPPFRKILLSDTAYKTPLADCY